MLLSSDHRNPRKHCRSYSEYKGGQTSNTKTVQLTTQIAKVTGEVYFINFKSTKNNVTLQRYYSKTITLSNLYEGNSSRHYKCKGVFTEEFQSISEL